MMYIHYCKTCNYIHMLNGHKTECPRCENKLTELKTTYFDYVDMGGKEREILLSQCADPEQLKEISTVYRMMKYSKRYKAMHKQETEKEL